MRISFMTFACPTWPLAEVLAAARKYGYDGVEPRFDAKHNHGIEPTATPAQRAEARKAFADSGIACCCLATSLQFIGEQAVTDAPARIDLAADVGAPGLRVFCGPIPKGQQMSLDDVVARVADNLLKVADYAKQRNVEIWIETHDTVRHGKPVGQIIDRCNHPFILANYDVMHPYCNGEPLETTTHALHGKVRHTHFHDAAPPGVAPCAPHQKTDGFNIVHIGEGTLPLPQIIRFLRAENYQGFLSGEWFESLGPAEVTLPKFAGGMRALVAYA